MIVSDRCGCFWPTGGVSYGYMTPTERAAGTSFSRYCTEVGGSSRSAPASTSAAVLDCSYRGCSDQLAMSRCCVANSEGVAYRSGLASGRQRLILFALILQASHPAPADSTMPPPPLHGGPQEMTCPVGGERFSPWRPAMFSTYGERPDGKPYSYLPFPFPLPECPSNRLIVFDDVTDAEKEVLSRIIAADEYKRLIETDTTYYRAYWLADNLGRAKPQVLGLLLSAIWQVTPDEMSEAPIGSSSARQMRYQNRFISEADQLGRMIEGKDRVWIEARAANAARQMKRFSDAERMRKRAERTLSSVPERRGWDTYLSKLRDVIRRGDATVEPLDMIPEQEVAFACIRQPSLTAFDRVACADPKVAARIAAARGPQP
jgi:hypothetical protein